jgi:O-acetylhomoserine/O-acetylserine sulfhydrylase-like pyridoxal-dependent enzyme
MNILLQNKKTMTYVADRSTRTLQRKKAHRFETGIEALFLRFNRQLKNLQIMGDFVEPRMNFTMPVTDLRGG